MDRIVRQESRAVARKPRDAAAVVFGLKLADYIHYNFKSSQVSKARLHRSKLVMGRCRYFASVSVFGVLVGFYKSRFGFRYRFSKISDIGSVFSVFCFDRQMSAVHSEFQMTPQHFGLE